jgi:hypothetical protein
MVKTAENFAAGFFGVPEYLDQVNIEILVEASGVNNSGAAYDVCNNSNIATKGSIGSSVAAKFANNAFNATLARLNSQVCISTLFDRVLTPMLGFRTFELHSNGCNCYASTLLIRNRRPGIFRLLRPFHPGRFRQLRILFRLGKNDRCFAFKGLIVTVVLLQQRSGLACFCRSRQRVPPRVRCPVHPVISCGTIRAEPNVR